MVPRSLTDPLAELARHLARRPRAPVPAALAAAALPALRRLDGGAARRDAALRAIARALDPDGRPWTQAGEVERALNRRERERTRARLMGTPCPRSALDELLDSALDAARPCRSQRGIYGVLLRGLVQFTVGPDPQSENET